MLYTFTEIKCVAVLKCFEKNWRKEDSAINIPSTNVIVERGVKLMEKILQNSKKMRICKCEIYWEE